MVAAFTFGKFAEVLEHAEKAWTLQLQKKRPIILLVTLPTILFYHALTLIELTPQVLARAAGGIRPKAGGDAGPTEVLGGQLPGKLPEPPCFGGRGDSPLEGRDLEAMKAYAQAITAARENGFSAQEGLANELAGRFYLGRGFDKNGDAHLRDARACYARWGADGKVKQLDQQYPHLVESRLLAPAATIAMRPEQLDLHAVTKASQTISGAIILDKLLRTLLTIVLEQGGAERACLVLRRDETPRD